MRQLTAVLTALLLLCGCWDYREISAATLIAGAAFDLDPAGGYILTAELIDFSHSGKESAPETLLLTARGATVPEAAAHLMRTAGKRPYWSHAAAFVVSRDFAERGLAPLSDFLFHNVDTALTAAFLVSALPTAREVLTLRTAGGGAVSYEIRSVMQNNAFFSQTVADFAYRTMEDLGDGGVCAVLAMAGAFEQDGEAWLDVSGSAVFDGMRMAAALGAQDTAALLALRGQPVSGPVTVPLPDGTPCALQLLQPQAAFEPQVLPDGRLRMGVRLETGAVIVSAETVGAESDPDVYQALEQTAGDALAQSLTGFAARMRRETGLDAFGFGRRFREAMPEAWSAWADDWDACFAGMDISVTARVRISRSSAGPAILTHNG